MFSVNEIFIADYKRIKEVIEHPTTDQIMLLGVIIRKMLIDENPLYAQANRGLKLKLFLVLGMFQYYHQM